MNPRVTPKLEFFPRLPAGACGHRCSRKRTEEPALESEARPGVLPSGGRAPPAPGTDPGRPRGGGGLSPRRCAEALGAGAPAPLPRPARHAPGGSGLPAGLPPVWTRAPAAQTPRRRPGGCPRGPGPRPRTSGAPSSRSPHPPPQFPLRRFLFPAPRFLSDQKPCSFLIGMM